MSGIPFPCLHFDLCFLRKFMMEDMHGLHI